MLHKSNPDQGELYVTQITTLLSFNASQIENVTPSCSKFCCAKPSFSFTKTYLPCIYLPLRGTASSCRASSCVRCALRAKRNYGAQQGGARTARQEDARQLST